MGDLDAALGPVLSRQHTNASLLQSVPWSQRVAISFNVSAFVPVLIAPSSGGSAAPAQSRFQKCLPQGCLPVTNEQGKPVEQPKERQVLFNVKGDVQPGQLLALMGPSGSGKSTLLSLLGGRSKARLVGDIFFNGQPQTKATKRSMGFVTQDDLLFAELTTFETLDYAARLRLPRDWSLELKRMRVEMVMQGLGLNKCRDTIIGNQVMRGVSGGERKRVSIGHELLINPSAILLDEPTSGLDSTTALKLIHTLRSLATGGRTIIASIHQPSSRLYQEFDQLLLLSEGHTLYYGEAHASAHWFAHQEVPVPFGVSIADHLLDLACGDLPDRSLDQSTATRDRLVQAFAQRTIGLGPDGIQPAEVTKLSQHSGKEEKGTALALVQVKGPQSDSASPPGSTAASSPLPGVSENPLYEPQPNAPTGVVLTRLLLPPTASQRHTASTKPAATDAPADAEAPAGSKWGATWAQQVAILLSRCLRTRRFQAWSIQRIFEVLVIAFMAGMFWFQAGGQGLLSAASISDITGLLFFQNLFMSFGCMIQSIFTFPADFKMLVKERQSGMYRLSAYYAARTISDIPMDCLIPTLFCWILYFMAGLRLQAGAFFGNWLGMVLTMLTAQSWGLLIGAYVSNPRTALAYASVLNLSLMLIGGFYVKHVPVWIGWLKYVSFIYYGYTLLLKVEFSGRGYNCDKYYIANPDAPPGLTYCSINQSGLVVTNVDTPVTMQVCVLVGMLITLRTLVYLSLRRRTSFKSA